MINTSNIFNFTHLSLLGRSATIAGISAAIVGVSSGVLYLGKKIVLLADLQETRAKEIALQVMGWGLIGLGCASGFAAAGAFLTSNTITFSLLGSSFGPVGTVAGAIAGLAIGIITLTGLIAQLVYTTIELIESNDSDFDKRGFARKDKLLYNHELILQKGPQGPDLPPSYDHRLLQSFHPDIYTHLCDYLAPYNLAALIQFFEGMKKKSVQTLDNQKLELSIIRDRTLPILAKKILSRKNFTKTLFPSQPLLSPFYCIYRENRIRSFEHQIFKWIKYVGRGNLDKGISSLETLDLGLKTFQWSRLNEFATASKLHSLNLSIISKGFIANHSTQLLPRSLTWLKLPRNAFLTNDQVSQLPLLLTLKFAGFTTQSCQTLPSSLTSLTFYDHGTHHSDLTSLSQLPAHLETLKLNKLEKLNMDEYPQSLLSLTVRILVDPEIIVSLPRSLTFLSLVTSNHLENVTLETLPPQLETLICPDLKISDNQLSFLPQSLTSLNVNFLSHINELDIERHLPALRSLTTQNELTSTHLLPATLTHLDVAKVSLSSNQKFPLTLTSLMTKKALTKSEMLRAPWYVNGRLNSEHAKTINKGSKKNIEQNMELFEHIAP